MLHTPLTEVDELPFFGSGRENAEQAAPMARIFSRVMASGKLLNGPEVFAFEDAIAKAAHRDHAVAVGSATDALYFALVAHGIGPGDSVLVPAYSFVASASCVLRAGATPIFVDVLSADADGAPGTMDLDDAARRIDPACRAMIWVGLFGGLDDPAPIQAFAEAHNLVLIEDASQTYGAAWGDQPAGAMGHTAVYSFDRNKLVGAPGTGGALVSNDPKVAKTAGALRYHGVGRGGYTRLGNNSQMSSLTAAILQFKLGLHPGWTARRNQIARAYDAALSDVSATVLRWPAPVRHVYHKYVFLTDRRAELATHLELAGVPTKRHYSTPLPREGVFAAHIPENAQWPVAEDMASRALSLPIYAQITDDEVQHITQTLHSFFG